VAVEIRLPTVLRQHAGGQATVKANGSTLGEALQDLVLQFPMLKDQVISKNGRHSQLGHRRLNTEQ